MNRIASMLAFAAVILATTRIHAATVRLDAYAYAAFSATGGPPTAPLVTDADGNVLNPTVGQIYEVWLALTVSDLGTLPNGKAEKGMASVQFDITLDELTESSLAPGWYLDQRYINLRGGAPGGLVLLWADLCNCGTGGPLDDIRVGVDVEDFPQGDRPPNNPMFDLRRTVGQGMSEGELFGRVFVDYLGTESASLTVSIDSFEVHDLEAVYPGIGTASGDTVTFVPEPGSLLLAIIGVFSIYLRFSHSFEIV
jgi:hypothetical protein